MIKMKIWGGEGVYYYFEEKAWKETQPFFWHLSPLPKPWLFTSFAFGNTGVSRLWHRGCDIQAPFSHHIHFCLSQHPISRILPSRNRQCVNCSSPRNNISHILHETQCTNSQFADISPQVSSNSNTGGFSWNFMEVKGGKLILDNSAEHVLPTGFLLCPHKQVWKCLASYQCMDSRAASTASFRHCKNNESGHQNAVLKSPCWVCWGY